MRVSSSFRDPSGELYWEKGRLFRHMTTSALGNYRSLMESGLYSRLVSDGLLIPHTESESPGVIEPEIVPFISYPYEWCFSMYKEAALATLEIQRLAMEYGMSLKDASAYNIQFRNGKAVLIDTLSFVALSDEPWVAYRQFCQHFLAPLALASYRDIRLGQLMKVFMDGIPLDLVSRLLPKLLNINLLLHLRAHAMVQGRVSKPMHLRMGRASKLGLLSNLEATVKNLKWRPKGAWYAYTVDTSYNKRSAESKARILSTYLEKVEPQTVWDLGANTGDYSAILARDGIHVVAFDSDPACVELCWQRYRNKLLPLVIDLSNPSPSIGWANKERMSLEERAPVNLVVALALIHHLALGNNVPLEMIAKWLSRLCQWLIVEFVPKEDEMVKKMLMGREDIFDQYTRSNFETVFGKYYRQIEKKEVFSSCRSIYLFQVK